MAKDTNLHFAAQMGDLEEVRRLLDDDPASVTAQGHGMRSPMMCASRWGRCEAIELLVSRGASMEQRDVAARTALMWAIQYGRTDMVALLLRLGAQVDATDMAGSTSLHHAVTYLQPDILELLLQAGAHPLSKDHEQATPRELLDKRLSGTLQAQRICHLLEHAEEPFIPSPPPDSSPSQTPSAPPSSPSSHCLKPLSTSRDNQALPHSLPDPSHHKASAMHQVPISSGATLKQFPPHPDHHMNIPPAPGPRPNALHPHRDPHPHPHNPKSQHHHHSHFGPSQPQHQPQQPLSNPQNHRGDRQHHPYQPSSISHYNQSSAQTIPPPPSNRSTSYRPLHASLSHLQQSEPSHQHSPLPPAHSLYSYMPPASDSQSVPVWREEGEGRKRGRAEEGPQGCVRPNAAFFRCYERNPDKLLSVLPLHKQFQWDEREEGNDIGDEGSTTQDFAACAWKDREVSYDSVLNLFEEPPTPPLHRMPYLHNSPPIPSSPRSINTSSTVPIDQTLPSPSIYKDTGPVWTFPESTEY